MVKKEESSSQAIEKSKTFASMQEKTNYLIGQAKAFYNAKEYRQAIGISEYVISNLDRNSMDAKNIIDKARQELESEVKRKADEMKKMIK